LQAAAWNGAIGDGFNPTGLLLTTHLPVIRLFPAVIRR
jgi:hypothetical protein